MKKKNVSKIYKRVLALMLALVMVLGALPATVSAEETPTPVEFDLAVLEKNAKSNSEQLPATGQDGGATWAFDTQNHWWHSKWSDRSGIASTSNPIWIQTGFDKVWTVTAVTYLPRQDGDGTMKGVIKNYTISTAKLDNPTATPSNADFTDVKSGTLDLNNTLFTINLDTPVEATHVRITVTETYQGWGAVDMGEGFVAAERINFLGYDPVEGGEDKPVSQRVQEMVDEMSLRDKITQMLMVDFRYWDEDLTDTQKEVGFTVMNDQVKKIVEDYNFGAIIYFAQNLIDTEQSYNLTVAMQEAATKDGGIPLIISADQEGGSVFRLGTGTALPGNMALGATFDTANAKKAGQIIGSELGALGINTNLAPVVDVNNNANNPVIGLRSYGDNAVAVGEMAAASIAGMAEFNVIGCAKHFPGHGDTATDSHYGLPIVDKSLDVLKETELKPYEVAIENGIEMIMTAHILYPQLESDKILSNKTGEEESLPATMSDDILTGLLKEDMGFEGIIITDAMNMAGIAEKWDQVQSVVIAFAAGVDMICMPCQLYNTEDLAALDAIIAGVEAAVNDGTIPMERIDDAVTRILTVKENRGILDYSAEDYTLENAMATVGSDANRATEREIAAKAVTVVKNENNVLPLNITADTNVLMLVPYNNERAQMLMGWNRAIEAGIIPYGAEVDYYRFSNAALNDELMEKLAWADIVIMNSEISSAARMEYDHWLSALPKAVTDYCAENEKVSVVMSVDKPYDVQLYPNADAVLAVYGCKGSSADPTEALVGGVTGTAEATGPNIIAGIEVALGTYGASGKLPVNIPKFINTETNEDGEEVAADKYSDEIVFERGFGLTYESKTAIAVDKTALKEAIAKAGEITDTTIYADSTEKAFTDALAAAQAVDADENATQYAVEKAAAELTAAQEALAMPADNSALKALVEANKEKAAEDYTEDTWAAFDEAMKAAEALLEVEATEAELAEATEVLQGAVDGLVKLFDDVLDPEQYYYDPVYWAAKNGITNGVTPTLFKPDDPCTRGQIVTFIWRALGEPATEVTETKFTDVDAKQFYYNSMLWAVGAGVVTGRTETTFAPDASCKRGEIVTMLWRAQGKPAPTTTEHTFTDVKEGEYYYDPMLWAVENQVTTGKTATTFAPDATITRAETVTFLSRVYAK